MPPKPPPGSYLGFSSWLLAPELGMHAREVLSRSSLVVAAAAGRARRELLVPAHVAAPYHFPHLFPEADWLHSVQPEHVVFSLDLWAPQPQGRRFERLAAFDLTNELFWSGAHDVGVVRLADEAAAEAALGALLEPVELASSARVAQGTPVALDGVRLVSPDGDGDGDGEDWFMQPLHAHGVVSTVHAEEPVFFAATDPQMPFGMCGCPVVRAEDGRCVGMLTGIVPEAAAAEEQWAPLVGHAGVLDASLLAATVASVS